MTEESINYLANQIIALYCKNRNTIEGIDEREVEAWVKAALATVGLEEYWMKYKADNQATVDGHWLVPFLINLTDITLDGVVRKQAILTEIPLSLPKNRGIVKVSASGYGRLDEVNYEAWDDLADGSVLEFTNKWWFSPLAGKVIILPACKDVITVPFTTVTATLAVSNNASLTETQCMLVYQKVFPLMDKRFGIKPDTRTDDYPTTQ